MLSVGGNIPFGALRPKGEDHFPKATLFANNNLYKEL